jgi:4-hydroxybenzoyl-CoA thioesterase
MSYRRHIPVEFNHCDPAGIVFYPRYFEMTNSVVENFFAQRLGRSYADITMRDRNGVPTVKIDATFLRPSRLGDRLEFTLDVVHLGTSSVKFALVATGDGERRMTAELTLVWITPDGRAARWPDELRERLKAEMTDESEAT